MKYWIACFFFLTGSLPNASYSEAAASPPSTRPARVLLTVTGEGLPKPLSLDAAAWAKLEHREFIARDKNGTDVHFRGVPLAVVLKEAGLTFGGHRPAVGGVNSCIVVEAADGYSAVFSMPESGNNEKGREIFIVDQREGKALDEKEGPLRVVTPGDAMPSRWVRQVISIRLVKP